MSTIEIGDITHKVELELRWDGKVKVQRETFKDAQIDNLMQKYHRLVAAGKSRVFITKKTVKEEVLSVDDVREIKPIAQQREDKRDELSKPVRRNRENPEERSIDLNKAVMAEQSANEEKRSKRGRK